MALRVRVDWKVSPTFLRVRDVIEGEEGRENMVQGLGGVGEETLMSYYN